MGFHICEYCPKDSSQPPASSSGDVTLEFANGHRYQAPDMLPHYVGEHGYCPPEQFVDDVLNTEFTGGNRRQTRSVAAPEPVGYLSGDYEKGPVPPLFLEKLERVMQLAAGLNERRQSKGIVYRGEEP